MLLISFVVKIRDGGSFYIFDFDDEEEQNISESYQPPRSNDNSSNTKEMEAASDRVDNSNDINSANDLKTIELLPPENNFLEEAKLITLPKSGYSPYNSYFGKGVYNNSADNYIKVTAPISDHIVFLLKDVYSKRTIRNEFIRKGSTFDLTGIPFGTYEFSYFSGDDWSNQQEMKNGEIKGGFTKNKSFSKSEKYKDRMEFKSSQYGGYEIKLISTVSGNLSTQTSNEDEFFN